MVRIVDMTEREIDNSFNHQDILFRQCS